MRVKANIRIKISTAPKRYALLSVFDKTGIVEFAKRLSGLGFSIISTGGTAKVLEENHIPVIPIQSVTGNPESFDGRMKTISFQIESGILFDRSKPEHVKQAKNLQIKPIDIVVCNLYPFEQTIAKKNASLADAIENIDVGGPTMIRAAAKNHQHVLVVTRPGDYDAIADALENNAVSKDFRQNLAAKAFFHLSFYDAHIARFLNQKLFPTEISLALRKTIDLRYGENPHQKAAVYLYPNNNAPIGRLMHQWGRELSHVNITDINAGIESVRLFSQPAAVIIKHNNPCGIALGRTIDEALKRAIDADPESAFGGIVVINKPMSKKAAEVIGAFKDARKANMDIVTAPEIAKDALSYLQKVRKSMGIYTFGQIPNKPSHQENIKWIDGGLVIQTPDDKVDESFADWKVATKKKPSAKQREQMQFGWKAISRIKSNAIIVVDKILPMTRGIGTGQTSRVRSTRIALEQAAGHAKGGVMISDSFFPFDDSVKLAAKHAIAAILQQGGSVNDQASIDAADRAGIIMAFTGRRAFWH